MRRHALDELLTTLDVAVHAVALCEIGTAAQLVFAPMGMVTVHYVLRGSGILNLGGAGSVSFGPKSIVVVPPGGSVSLASSPHPVRTVEATEAATMMTDGLLGFSTGDERPELVIVSGTITATYAGGFGLFDRLSAPLVEEVAEVDFLAAAIDLLLEEVRSPGLATRAFTESLMRQCLLMILRSHYARTGADSPLFAPLHDEKLARAVQAVLKQPGGAHTLSSLAAEAGMSRSAFGERFAQTFGQTPFEFVQKVRLRQTAHLMRSTDLPVKLIAKAAGFASRTHFARTFAVAFGMTPTEYRKRYAASDALTAPLRADPAAAMPNLLKEEPPPSAAAGGGADG